MWVNSSFSYSSWSVGQRVRLRDGTEREVTEVWDQKTYFPVRCGGAGWTDVGTWTRVGRSSIGGESYTSTKHDKDIVAIISDPRPASAKPKTGSWDYWFKEYRDGE